MTVRHAGLPRRPTPTVRSAWRAGVLTVGLFVTSHSAWPAEVIRYTAMTSDKKVAGEQVVTHGDDGMTTVRYLFKDNGRGPELTERMRLAPNGTLAEYEVSGKATMGGAVDERFTRADGKASWKSKSEQGQAPDDGSAFYLPIDSSYEPASASIRAAAARPDGKLPLFPSGTLTQTKLDEVQLTRGAERLNLQLLSQTGMWFTPSYYWATTGDRPRLFAALYPPWQLMIEAGWEGQVDTLLARQREAELALHKSMAERLRQPMPGLTVIRNARVFDSLAARLRPALSDVYVLRDRITAVLPAGSVAQEATLDIDAAGRVLLPGLFDMHAHLDRWDGSLNLAAGVTSARDMGNDNAELQAIMDQQARGELLMPRITAAGFLEGKSEFSARSGRVISSLAEAKAAVDWYAQRGYRQLKIYNSFPRDMVRETVAYAHARGLRVSGHVPAFMRAQQVVEQGFDEVQHINQLMLNFLVTPSTDTRTLERFTLPAEKLASLDLQAKPVRDFVALLKKRRTVIDPTLATFDFMQQRDGDTPEPFAQVMARFPPNVQRSLRTGGLNIPDDATARRYKASYDKMVAFVGLAYRAGIPLVAGTDQMAGFTLHSELALYVKAGLTPAQALQVATLNGARYSGTLHDLGSIEVGKRADLVLVDGDPTRDIAELRKVVLVLTQGYLIKPQEVHAALGIAPMQAALPSMRVSARPAAPEDGAAPSTHGASGRQPGSTGAHAAHRH